MCIRDSRKTAQALYDLYGIRISHQQVANYARTAAIVIKPFVDHYEYPKSSIFTADETYIKVRGIKGYLWFIMDAASRSILGYQAVSYTHLALYLNETLQKLEDKDVRIIYLPPMTVAAAHFSGNAEYGVGPEATGMIEKFVYETELLKIKPDARGRGFDCSRADLRVEVGLTPPTAH